MRYLEDCDMKFHNLEDTRPKLPFTLILNCKISTHGKEKGSRQPRTKTEKKRVKQNSRARFKAASEENTHRSIGKPILLIIFLFSHLLFNQGDVFDG